MTSSAEPIEEARQLLAGGAADADALYACWFHRQTGKTRDWPDEASYRAAMLDEGRFERGWRAVQPAAGRMGAVLARRGSLERNVAPPEMAPLDSSRLSPGPGDALLVDPLATGFSGGFWHIWSAGWQQAAPRRLTRLYFNLEPINALNFAARVAAVGPVRASWAAKVLCGSHEHGRRDGALLYLPLSRGARQGWPLEVIASAGPWCREDLPPFVSRLAPGIGQARDPGPDRSFGQALCRALWSFRALAEDKDAFRAAASREARKLGASVP